jgi:3-hydroxyacyl-CoA dehydrogenase / 3-hydroxy-2-methylbutyryl-CoA dehydrogenase
MALGLESARALVTGGASGLGRAVAERVIAAGGKVAVLDIDQENGDATARELGERALYLHTDVTSERSVDAAIAWAVDAFGSITLAVNCAGVAQGGRLLGRDGPMPSEAFERVLDINLVGTFRVCRAAANAMQHNGGHDDGERGVIVNTASIAAYEGQIGQVAYAASKGGIVSMTLPLARELGAFGIRVVTIAPGVFHTPFFDRLSEPRRSTLIDATPFPGRPGRPREFADLVAHVYENPMFNGSVIRLDGGLHMPPR